MFEIFSIRIVKCLAVAMLLGLVALNARADATVSAGGGGLLMNVTANNTTVTITAQANSYTFALSPSGNWTGSGSGLSGIGSSTLTITSGGKGEYVDINLGVSNATGVNVTFADSGANTYSNGINFTVNGTVTFNGKTTISGFPLIISTSENIVVSAGAVVTATTGNAYITLVANQQTPATTGSFHGIQVLGTVQSTGSGSVTVYGIGGNGGNFNGVYVSNGGTILSGSGLCDVEGTGGAGSNSSSSGVAVDGSGSKISSAGGNVKVVGTGGGASGSGTNCYGVNVLNSGLITAGGTGSVTVTGTGGIGLNGTMNGVQASSGGKITSGGGNVSVMGNASASGGAGVECDGGVISAGGTGTITVKGTGTSTGIDSNGVHLTTDGGAISSSGGNIFIMGESDAGGSDVILQNGEISTKGTGNLTVTANTLFFPPPNGVSGASINVGANTVTFVPRTAGTLIDLGGASARGTPSTLGVEFDSITAGTIALGNSSSGAMTVTDHIVCNPGTNVQLAPAAGNSVTFATGSSIDTSGGTLTVTTSGGGTLQYDAGSAFPLFIANLSAFSKTNVIGTLDIAGGTGVTLTPALEAGSAYVPATGDQFSILTKDGTDAISGTFLDLPEGGKLQSFLGTTRVAGITYAGGTGNDIVLTVLSNNDNLSTLGLGGGLMTSTPFQSTVYNYNVFVAAGTPNVTVSPLAADPTAVVTVNGDVVAAGDTSAPITINSGANLVTIVSTAQDGSTATYTVNFVTNEPPVIQSMISDDNPALVDATVSYTFIATDADTDMLTYTFDFGDGSAVLSGSFEEGDSVTVSHVYTAYTDGVTVTLAVSDGVSTATRTRIQTVPSPSSSGLGVPSPLQGETTDYNPHGHLGLSVKSSNGGVLQLAVDTSQVQGGPFDLSTGFVDNEGLSTVTGDHPVHKYSLGGIYVATTGATHSGTNTQAAMARLSIPVTWKETGQTEFTSGAEATALFIPKGISNTTAANTSIVAKALKGKFDFKQMKPDTVTFDGTVKMPAGVDVSMPYELWFSMGNNVVRTIVSKGKGVADPAVGTPGILKSLKAAVKVKKGQLTVGGEIATITVAYLAKGLVASGFDGDGISDQSTDLVKNKAVRNIQVAIVLQGSAYVALVPAEFSLTQTKNADSGAITLIKTK